MLKNYILISVRNILKYKIFATINIIGLSLGLVSSFLIILFVVDEYSTNSWIRNVENQYFLESEWSENVDRLEFTTLAPLAKHLKDQYPHLVENYFRIHGIGANASDGKGKNFRLNVQIGDSTLLEMFGLPLLHGDRRSALDDPSAIVIMADVARKFFGRTDVIGETLNFKTENEAYHAAGNKDYVISGVIDDLPQNSLTDNLGDRNEVYMNQRNISYYGSPNMFENWGVDIIQARIELAENVIPEDLIEPMRKLVQQNAPDYLRDSLTPKLTALSTYNLTNNEHARYNLLIILSCAAGFILLMAVLNFINISLGMSVKRLKEIGVRKVVGGVRRELIVQFIAESLVFALLACLLALGITQMVLPYFASLVEKPLLFSNIDLSLTLSLFLATGVVTGILAGIYPAVILSRKKTIQSLKGKLQGGANQRLRKSLLAVQFVIAIFFVVCATVVSDQTSFFLNKDTGYSAENVMVISSLPRTYSDQGVTRMLDLKNEFLKIPSVKHASLSYEIPDGRRGRDIELTVGASEEFQFFPLISTDSEYLETYGIPLIEGRFYTLEDVGKNRIVINETAARSLFGEESAIGKTVKTRDHSSREIIGIIKDYHFGSLHNSIQGNVFINTHEFNFYRYYSFQLSNENIRASVQEVESVWRTIFPKSPFVYFFMKDKLKELYKAESQFERALYITCFFSLCIVLIGLFGVALQNLSERTKEIGIRKTLGASITHICSIMVKDYVVLSLLGCLIAFPLAYFTMNKWLENYAYHIKQSPFVYLSGLGLIFVLTMLTISYQLWKASRANPVDSLRYE